MNNRSYSWRSNTHTTIGTEVLSTEVWGDYIDGDLEHPEKRDYQSELDDIPTEEIERYLRKKKLDKIRKKK